MVKQRLLVVISFSFSIRYLYRTGLLCRLKNFAEVIIAITWNEKNLIEELRSNGFEVYIIPASEKKTEYDSVRKKIDYWFNLFRLNSSTRSIQVKYLNQYLPFKNKFIRIVREQYNNLKFLFPPHAKNIFKNEAKLLKTHTNYSKILHWVNELRIDAVFTVTPFHKQEDLLLRACKNSNKKMITAILSFDNLTKRSWLPVEYDTYMVWNKYNYEELNRIYLVNKKIPIHITGAPQFDFYFDKDYLYSIKEWKTLLGLPDDNCKIILYAGGPAILFPTETQYLKRLDDAIKSNEIQNHPIILFRCHPIDNIERWKKMIGNSPNVFFDSSWTGKDEIHSADITKNDIKKLCSTLAYTDVHINLCSTMTVDGSAFNKPQIGPAYDEINPSKEFLLQQMYQQEHFLPIMETGGLLLATSKKSMIEYVNKALLNPGLYNKKCRIILENIITYTDGKSTDRVASVIKNFLKPNTENIDGLR